VLGEATERGAGHRHGTPATETQQGGFRRRSLGRRAYALIGGAIALVIAVLTVVIIFGNSGSHYTITLAITAPGQSVSLVLTGNESAVRNASAQMTSGIAPITSSGLGVSIETLGGDQHHGARSCQITGPSDGVQVSVYSINPGSAMFICTEIRRLGFATG
jgi:hypothetical protein